MKKRLLGMLAGALALVVLLGGFAALAEGAEVDYAAYVGRYSGADPWEGRIDVIVEAVEDGAITWSFSEVFTGLTLYQAFEKVELTDGVAPFHLEGEALYDEAVRFDYTGELALRDGMVSLTFETGAVTEESSEGGSSSHHAEALDEAARTVVLEPTDAVTPEAIERFSDTWVDENAAVEIWYDGGVFHCYGVLGDGGDSSNVLDYEFCRYDAAEDAVCCDGGVRTYEEWDMESDQLISDVVVQDLTATFTLDEQDRLIWNDSEGICKRFALQRLSVAEEQEARANGELFLGTWVCVRCSIDIDREGDDVMVWITWPNTAAEVVEWKYPCTVDAETGALRCEGKGTKTVVTYAEGGEIESSEVVYEDGDATFTLDEDGDTLTWADAKENAGEDMVFEYVIVDDELYG